MSRRPGRRRPEPKGWELEHSPFTFEGEIEGLGRFAAGAGRAGGRRRLVQAVAVVALLAFLLPVVAALYGVVAGLLGR